MTRALTRSRMVTRLLAAGALMAVCVVIHGSGLAWALRTFLRSPPRLGRPWRITALFVAIAGWIVLLHLVEIAAWAGLYIWSGAMADLQSALYFSAVTYTTTGYGDLVLPKEFRLDGGVEALTGILMCGWSTGFFFTIVNRFYERTDHATSN